MSLNTLHKGDDDDDDDDNNNNNNNKPVVFDTHLPNLKVNLMCSATQFCHVSLYHVKLHSRVLIIAQTLQFPLLNFKFPNIISAA